MYMILHRVYFTLTKAEGPRPEESFHHHIEELLSARITLYAQTLHILGLFDGE